MLKLDFEDDSNFSIWEFPTIVILLFWAQETSLDCLLIKYGWLRHKYFHLAYKFCCNIFSIPKTRVVDHRCAYLFYFSVIFLWWRRHLYIMGYSWISIVEGVLDQKFYLHFLLRLSQFMVIWKWLVDNLALFLHLL